LHLNHVSTDARAKSGLKLNLDAEVFMHRLAVSTDARAKSGLKRRWCTFYHPQADGLNRCPR